MIDKINLKNYNFSEALDLMLHEDYPAFTCDFFMKEGEYIAFEDEIIKLFSPVHHRNNSKSFKQNNDVLYLKKEKKANYNSQNLIITIDLFSYGWYPVDQNKDYNLEATFDLDFTDEDIMYKFGKPYEQLSHQEREDFFYEMLESAMKSGETAVFMVDEN